MRNRKLAYSGIIIAVLCAPWIFRAPLAEFYGLPPFTHELGEQLSSRVAMRDGVALETQVFLPEGGGPWPTVLIRTPYNPLNGSTVLCRIFARQGFSCVHQDVRGRHGSDGVWQPFENERNDGLDTLAWLVEQPWTDGNVGLWGMSYLAAVQWVMADEFVPQVKTMVPMVFGTDLYAMGYRDGMFRHEVFSAWAALMPQDELSLFNGGAYQDLIRHRPAREADEAYLGMALPWYRATLDAPARDDAHWERARWLNTLPAKLDVPVLMFGGWYDFSVGPMFEMFAALGSRADSKMIMGPWNHLQEPAVGDWENDRDLAEQMAISIRWLRHQLADGEWNESKGVVEAYELGAGQWHDFAQWPPPGQPWVLHLADASGAPACSGGELRDEPAADPQHVEYTYRPDDPVPSRGGAALLAFALPGFGGVTPGPAAQDGLCERDDILSFVSEPTSGPVTLAGAPSVTLTVSSDAPDTAFTAKLVEVGVDGTERQIREGITSLAFRNGASARQSYEVASPVEITIPLDPILWRMPTGARLRLDVSSSSFPAFHNHPNRAEPWAQVREPRPARQTLYIGADRVARVSLLRWPADQADQ